MRRAFTLVEILIVLFVVGVLAALLFPTFARARENARRSSCQSNLKQIGLGILQYVRDYDETFPLAYADSDGSGAYNPYLDNGWMQILQPYIKSTAVFQCPSEDKNYFPPLRATDYWYSAPVSQTDNMNVVAKPSQTVMCGDGVGMPAAFVATHGAIAYKGDAPSLKYNRDIWDIGEKTEGKGGRRHLSGLNLLFCDGHVKWYKPATVGAATVDENAPNTNTPTFRVN